MMEHVKIEQRGGGTFKQLRIANHQARTRTVFYLLGFTAFIGWTYVFFNSSLFKINDFHISGLKTLDAIEVEREVYKILDMRTDWRPWSARHAWFIDQSSLTEQLKERLFALNVSVDNSYFNVLRLTIEERVNRLVFHSHQQYYWVDLQGLAIIELTAEERKFVQGRLLGLRPITFNEPPIIHCDLNELIAESYSVAEPLQIRTWIQAATEIVKQGILYRELEPPLATSGTTAVLISDVGHKVLLDFSVPLEPQLRSYNTYRKVIDKENLSVSEYVDVRIPGKLFVK